MDVKMKEKFILVLVLRSLVDQNEHNFIRPTSHMANYTMLRFGSVIVRENSSGNIQSWYRHITRGG
uniref:Uncharacterized protein n=1 Tax=Helianthus annuus TaxID=4232 RepID=A0A251V310_HELAN